ncbi:19910_t:CDS:2, partial [Gigaspora margarita]
FGDIKNYFTVSDDKFVSMPISEEKDKMKVVIKDDEDLSKIECIKRIKVGIFNFETGKNVSLKLPHSEIIVETLAFLDGNNLDENKLTMISKYPLCRIYIFTREDDEFIHKSTIKVETYDEKIFLSNGKLFIYDENLGSITKWDINTSKFEAYFLFDNSFDVDNMKLSDNGVLLFVYGKKRGDNWYKDPYPCISVYSADHGNKFTTFIIDTVCLIASNIGARLLIVHHKKNEKEKKYQYHLCDPFAPYIPEKREKNYVEANDLFKDFETNSSEIFENKYIIKNDKIVGFKHDGNLVIERLIHDDDNWISYLRNELRDFDRIFISSVSEKIIDLIRLTIDKSKETTDKATAKEETIEEVPTDIDKSKEKTEKATLVIFKDSKYFVTWTLKYETLNLKYEKKTFNERIILTAEIKNDETKTDSIQIAPEAYIKSGNDIKQYVKEFDCLDNDDLVIVTARSVFIWTFNTEDYKIELNYRWENGGNSWDWNEENGKEIINLFYKIDEKYDENNFDIKKLTKKSYFLPPSSYISMIRDNHAFPQSESPKDNKFFFNELIEKHINNKFFLILYGQKLIEDIVKEDKDTWLRKLFDVFHVNELREFISKINSDDWKESTKPILTKIMKVMNDEKQESEADKIQKIYVKQESEANKIQKIYEKQESEADKIQKIQKMLEKVMKKLDIQFSDENDDSIKD